MITPKKYTAFKNRKLVMLGFGSIGPAVLPLILRHIDITPEQIEIISNVDTNRALAEQFHIKFNIVTLTEENFRTHLQSLLKPNDVLLNLSVGISSLDLIRFCHEKGILYLDTSLELWTTELQTPLTAYDRRKIILAERNVLRSGVTALTSHGANPGLITHFAKKAVLDVARKLKLINSNLSTQQLKFGELAKKTGIVSLHVTEVDSQMGASARQNHEYVNTWSINAFMDEASQFSQFAWGSHEQEIPGHLIRRHMTTENCHAIELSLCGAAIRMKSWVPQAKLFHGYIMPHHEAFSLAELFSVKHDDEGRFYQPTVMFVYKPCNDAVLSMHDAAAQAWKVHKTKRLLINNIVSGVDELGILILRHQSPDIYWFGSVLDTQDAYQLAPNNNATSMQVAAGVLSGLVWIIDNPQMGLIEPEQVDFERALEVASPYLGKLEGHWSRWDTKTQWQFSEFLKI